MRFTSTRALFVLALLLIIMPLMSACGGNETTEPSPTPAETTTAKPTPEPTQKPTQTIEPSQEPAKNVVVTIGNLTDKTGPASQALFLVDTSLADVVRYFNEENLIPGVELKVVEYDGQYDPSKDIPGYKWLKEKGSDVFFSAVPATSITLKSLLDEDENVLFALTTSPEIEETPGHVFAMNIAGEPTKYTFLKWLAENDPNFPKDRPAKIGAVGMVDPYEMSHQAGMEQYANAHPDQYEWVGGYLADWTTVTWGPEVAALMECDYVKPPSTGFFIQSFMKEFRDAGGTAKFIGDDAQIAYLGLLVQGVGWDLLDGMLVSLINGWYNDPYEMADLTNKFLTEYHSPDEAAALRSGGTYMGGVTQAYGMVSIVAKAINDAGPKNFTPQVLYDTAQSFSMTYGGGVKWNFSDTKRTAWNAIGIYKLDADIGDLARADPEWQMLIYEP